MCLVFKDRHNIEDGFKELLVHILLMKDVSAPGCDLIQLGVLGDEYYPG